ncbi:hypothetical protein BKA80DRAFT_276608 [Phyllosticta citrichinensis]
MKRPKIHLCPYSDRNKLVDLIATTRRSDNKASIYSVDPRNSPMPTSVRLAIRRRSAEAL